MVSRFTKTVVILNCTVPVSLLAWDAFHGDLGANPVNFAIRTTGALSLIFLILSLAVTPVLRLGSWGWLGQFRRVLGLYAFFHAAVHFGLFFVFDRSADVGDTLAEIWLRPYLLVGMIGLLAMVPLAVTSTDGMIRRLGPKRWKLLHRLAYVAASAGALHYYLLVKADTTWPALFAILLGVLLAYRLMAHYLQLRSDSARYRRPAIEPAANPARPRQWKGTLRVAKIFTETPLVRTFRLVMPTGAKLGFDYDPGQYLNLALEIDGKTVRRSYTIASPPTRSGYCELTVKREENGLASRHLHDAVREGDLLNVSAPAGRFTFTGAEADRIVMIAGGVGITPLMSKIRYLTDVGWKGRIDLLVSVKMERDIIFRRELEELQRRFGNLNVTVTLSREASATWTGEHGRINADLLQRTVPEIAGCRVHLCGPTEMTDPLIAILQELGVPADQIKVESFASPSRILNDSVPAAAPLSASLAPVGATSAATLHFSRTARTIAYLDGKTVLEIAEDHGISLPYDCRSGICGQCKVRLLSGSVSMDIEDALDRVDRSQGLILTCQARCQDDVVLEA